MSTGAESVILWRREWVNSLLDCRLSGCFNGLLEFTLSGCFNGFLDCKLSGCFNGLLDCRLGGCFNGLLDCRLGGCFNGFRCVCGLLDCRLGGCWYEGMPDSPLMFSTKSAVGWLTGLLSVWQSVVERTCTLYTSQRTSTTLSLALFSLPLSTMARSARHAPACTCLSPCGPRSKTSYWQPWKRSRLGHPWRGRIWSLRLLMIR